MTIKKPFYHQAWVRLVACAVAGFMLPNLAAAQPYQVTAEQKAVANTVASQGVPLSELKPQAPQSHVVVTGDTLWAISNIFLTSPWRWPELWGMNIAQIRNPHLIYPGQVLTLSVKGGMATLQLAGADGSTASADLVRVRLSPKTRVTALPDNALPTLKSRLIEPFLSEPIIVGEEGLRQAPRIVSAQDDRVLLTKGDRAYARSTSGSDLMDDPKKKHKVLRIFRNATPLKDPLTGAVLGYEAQYVGRALLTRSEGSQTGVGQDGKAISEVIPASIDIVAAKEEIRVGDRLLSEPEQLPQNYVPHAAKGDLEARVVSVYGSAVVNAAQNQVVVINKGRADGIDPGQILAVLNDGARVADTTDPQRAMIKLPDERNGLLMVFRSFDKLSYALVLEITRGVKIGDRLRNPQ